MTYKTPKEIEKVPIIVGIELKKVIFIIVAALSFVFLVNASFLLASIFPVAVGFYIYISNKFKKEGELISYLKFLSTSKITSFDKTVEQLLNIK